MRRSTRQYKCILGPLLFLIFINDTNNAVGDDRVKLYADDTNLFVSGSDIQSTAEEANTILAWLNQWFVANKLSINLDKSCYVHFGPSENNNIVLDLDGTVLLKVNYCK